MLLAIQLHTQAISTPKTEPSIPPVYEEGWEPSACMSVAKSLPPLLIDSDFGPHGKGQSFRRMVVQYLMSHCRYK
jgi:hypothetical protein